MKVAILAGGMGTRLAEETDQRPKPMVEIGGKPILWHLMKYYSSFGMNEFILGLGYKKETIIRYFLDLYYYSSDLTINTGDGSITVHQGQREPSWVVHLIDTGLLTDTGGRIKRLAPYIGDFDIHAYLVRWFIRCGPAWSPRISSLPSQARHCNHSPCASPLRLSRS